MPHRLVYCCKAFPGRAADDENLRFRASQTSKLRFSTKRQDRLYSGSLGCVESGLGLDHRFTRRCFNSKRNLYFISRSVPGDGPLLVPALASSSSLSFSFLALITSQSTATCSKSPTDPFSRRSENDAPNEVKSSTATMVLQDKSEAPPNRMKCHPGHQRAMTKW